jgi:hypothetical protein
MLAKGRGIGLTKRLLGRSRQHIFLPTMHAPPQKQLLRHQPHNRRSKMCKGILRRASIWMSEGVSCKPAG